jgi:hypothetical protein
VSISKGREEKEKWKREKGRENCLFDKEKERKTGETEKKKLKKKKEI